ncbi:hypothetical protein Val02_63630 [Virgisporangium aliadipatigenens]|uniref:Bacterial sugar transferase domain-containing protein n=1 Tax=Virgisporangium aliadipatigenens TaxID=741659 RepID=A0A8J3YS38_9ACTN|nr:hypothetical protein Val02_63630 [Virgisporangium aliadipatigenens]
MLDLTVAVAISVAAASSFPATLLRALALVAAFAAVGLYRRRLRFSVLDDLPRLLLGVVLVLPTELLVRAEPRLAVPALLGFAALIGRLVGYGVLHARRRRRPGVPTLVIGTGDVAVRLTEVLAADRTFGLAPMGLVGPPSITEPTLPAPLLGPIEELETLAAELAPGAVVVTFAGTPDANLVGLIRHWRSLGVAVFVVPRLFELALGEGQAELVQGIPLVRMRPEPPRRWRRAAKRALDVAGAAFGIAMLAPVLVACALAVKWESGRAGVIFKQERIGRGGKPFTILKFRSLTPATETESQVKWNIGTDHRVGPVGRFIRATSLDELPQLFNVLRGDMSLVGPRPERPYFVDQFQRTYAGYADRHRVQVGITGWAQINGLRGDTSIEERTRFDNYYIENWSLGMDIKIIVRTFGSMLGMCGR